MITIKTIYDHYPDNDLLGVAVTADTTLVDVERTVSGDTLFLFLCRELADCGEDACDITEAIRRCEIAIADIRVVRDGIRSLLNENHTGAMAFNQQENTGSSPGAAGS